MRTDALTRELGIHLIRLLKNFGLVMFSTVLVGLVSNLFDPNHGPMTLALYSACWTLTFFLVGISTHRLRWLYVLVVASLFSVVSVAAGATVNRKVALLFFMTALFGGALSHLYRRR
jgi:hypothetical protein